MERRSDPFVNDGRLEYIDVGLAEVLFHKNAGFAANTNPTC